MVSPLLQPLLLRTTVCILSLESAFNPSSMTNWTLHCRVWLLTHIICENPSKELYGLGHASFLDNDIKLRQ